MPQNQDFTPRATPFNEFNSEEVQEIISRPPNWLISWGITLFFGVMVLLGLGTWLIRYPDTITAPFTLIATEAPRAIVAQTEGELTKLFVKNGQQVLKGQTVAYLESAGDHEQIIKLEKEMEQISHAISNNRWDSVRHFPIVSYKQLGELQNDFQFFNQKLTGLKSFLVGGIYYQKQKGEILGVENAIEERKIDFLQSLHALCNSIDRWRQKYILTAPVAGKVSFSMPCHEEQYLIAGQELMTVGPTINSFQGIVKIPQPNIGKLKEGQTVLIKLDGFPHREYGMVEGKLAQLSNSPGKDDSYWGYIELPDKLKTRYGHTLSYRNGLKGQAEIITADRRLAERLLSTIRVGGK
ncbi:HlyD family secretion protein [Dyadobacter fermentans]|uniref:AprE-like beta-barrel domain-containing protein n=1 Tax=Dyadobacter fermentans (strain ATCC 700827 / DSM 18053 / CIP 107007 / KCTC 52180 / NS114) TaxID=471854 RepID=C6VT81_DYAFD|nr:HlyD family efflux transporter periplasmic adaptor subunit [Dyadobacter fermentans]ACT96445.1 hypothetical protein Dfer_5251 [Dyadobacter fermentans DSM 18053]